MFVVAAAVLYGWEPATLLAAVSMASVEVGRRRPPSRIAYNTALYALSAAAAGFAREGLPGDGLAWLVAGTLLASTAFYAVDITLLSAVISRSRRQGIFRLWGRFLASTAGPFAIMASFTLILVALWDRSPWIALALAAPLAAIALYQRWIQGALDRLRELDRLKNEFIAVVSHELRTPLASVYGAGMTLQRQDLDERVRDSMLAIIYGESARLARLVDQVLWASRLESGRVEAGDERSDGAEVAAEVVEAARTHVPTGLEIELRVPEPLPEIAAGAEKVKQILVNLVENAVKYSPDGGVIEVAVEPTAGCVCFSVRDQGLGIPLADQERIFEKFHRLDPLLTRGVGGTGLGLYICRQLVLELGGRIRVESREGEGSTFSVELPAALPPETTNTRP